MHVMRMIIAASLASSVGGAAFAQAAPAHAGLPQTSAAQGVRPVQAQSLDLGQVAGDLYYTVKPDGYHVVATFAERNAESVPVRFETTLAPGQIVTLSAPRAAGEPANNLEISRQNGRVLVRKVAIVD